MKRLTQLYSAGSAKLRAKLGLKMKRELTFLPIVILFPYVALGNPVVSPAHVLGFVVVVGTSLLVEVAITTGCLTLVGMSAGTVFAALLVINIGTYFGILLPALDAGFYIIILEALVVMTEGAVIKLISCFAFFQGGNFSGLKWRYAFGAAALGNAFSYWIGNMLS